MIPPIELITFRNRRFWLLRDDLIDEKLNGNKARKLYYLLNSDLSRITHIVSYGSSQSNAMFALSVFALMKGLKFVYVISHLNSYLKSNPTGNYAFALKNNMHLINMQDDTECDDKNIEEYAKEVAKSIGDGAIFIPEGVACRQAQAGFALQADVIDDFCEKNNVKPDIFLPSGTGTSATYLSKYTNLNVFTCPCVGDEKYLKEQIYKLDTNANVNILSPPKKYAFAKPYFELYEIWQELLDESGVEFDLLYDPIGFLTIFSNLDRLGDNILYIHQGGQIGNITQLQRYKYKFKDLIKG